MNQQLCKGVPIESRSWLMATSGLVMGPLALIAIALRCYSRLTVTREFGYDDTVMAVVAVFLAALIAIDAESMSRILSCSAKCVLTGADSMQGFGRHCMCII